MAASKPNTLCYEGYNYFRERLILATLSGKSVKLKIKLNAEDIGANGKLNLGHMYVVIKSVECAI
jgi:hypothetical protein